MHSLATGTDTVPKFDDIDGFIRIQPFWESPKLENQVLGASEIRSLLSKLRLG